MINLMIVAGDRTEQLSKFMEERGTFSVNYSYESLSLNLSNIKDSIIMADQLLYLYQEEIIDIRVDMQLLKDLLINNGFFTVKEIVFIVPECKSAKKAINYFNTVMKSSGFSNYSIKQVNEKPSFNDIYDSLIGVSKAQQFKNSYNNIYRVERGVDSKIAYEEQDDFDLTVEPFSYDKLKAYDMAKLTAQRAESGVVHQDELVQELEKFKEPVLGQIEINSVLTETESFLVTGLEKSGISTWSVALAESTKKTGKPITIIDFTDNRDIIPLLEQQGLAYSEVNMLSMIKLYRPKTGVLNVCTIHNDREDSVKMEFLQNIYSGNKIDKGFIFIAANLHSSDFIADILCNDLTRTFFCITPLSSDILRVQNYLAEYTEKHETILVLNNRLKLLENMQLVGAEEVKKLLPFSIPVVQPINFETLDMDLTLFNALIKRKEQANG